MPLPLTVNVPDKVLDINGTERHVVLKDLHSSTIYDILLLTSTIGGSVNGSIVTVKTPSIGI